MRNSVWKDVKLFSSADWAIVARPADPHFLFLDWFYCRAYARYARQKEVNSAIEVNGCVVGFNGEISLISGDGSSEKISLSDLPGSCSCYSSQWWL